MKPEANFFEREILTYRDLNDEEFAQKYREPHLNFAALPDCKEKNRVLYAIREYQPLLDSVNLTLCHWTRIAKDIEANYANFDSFVVLHGTDTLAYTATALSFMLENLGKPVIVTGAQISLFSLRSDGRTNFVTALLIAGNYAIPEVCVVFNNKLMRGNRVIKYSSEKFDAFQSLQFPPLAEFSTTIDVNWKNVFRPMGITKFQTFTNFCTDTKLLRMHPNITIEEVRTALYPPTRAVIVETYGAGNIPTNRKDVIDEVTRAIESGVIVVNVSQCPDSMVAVIYETGAVAEEIGMISGIDMTSVAAYIKVSYLVGKGYSTDEIKEMMKKNIRGELTQRMTNEDDLVTFVGQFLGYTKAKDISDVKSWLEPFLMSHAVTRNDLKLLETLEKSSCNFSATNTDRRSALHIACTEGKLEIVKFLLESGANVHIKDRFNRTPLLEAIQNTHTEIVKLLLDTGAHLTTNKLEMGTLLCQKAAQKCLKELELFSYAGADLDAQDYHGRSALHVACLNGDQAIIKFLLAKNCNLLLKDKLGITPKEIAEKLNYEHLLQTG